MCFKFEKNPPKSQAPVIDFVAQLCLQVLPVSPKSEDVPSACFWVCMTGEFRTATEQPPPQLTGVCKLTTSPKFSKVFLQDKVRLIEQTDFGVISTDKYHSVGRTWRTSISEGLYFSPKTLGAAEAIRWLARGRSPSLQGHGSKVQGRQPRSSSWWSSGIWSVNVRHAMAWHVAKRRHNGCKTSDKQLDSGVLSSWNWKQLYTDAGKLQIPIDFFNLTLSHAP